MPQVSGFMTEDVEFIDGQLRAVATIDGVEYIQGELEPTPVFEGRVEADLLSRRSQELILNHGLNGEQAARAIEIMMEAFGVGDNVGDVLQPMPITGTMAAMGRDSDIRVLADEAGRWQYGTAISVEAAAAMARMNIGIRNLIWLQESAREIGKALPDSFAEPTAMELWRD